MAKVSKILEENKSEESKSILHGSDVPRTKHTGFKVKIREFRNTPPGWKSMGILDIEEVFEGKSSIPLNKTIIGALAEKLGDDTEKWAGKSVDFIVIFQRNPKTNKNVPALAVKE